MLRLHARRRRDTTRLGMDVHTQRLDLVAQSANRNFHVPNRRLQPISAQADQLGKQPTSEFFRASPCQVIISFFRLKISE